MDTTERRTKILKILSSESQPITGSKLAEILDVSRQVIVQDIAILRAAGEKIIATPQGYILSAVIARKPRRVLAAEHDAQGMPLELNTIVDLGGKVIDVIVEHPLYGEIRGLMMLSNQQEVEEFLAQYRHSEASLLSSLTKGVHLHTIEADTEEKLDEITEALRGKGLLLSQA
ncbi:MAG: transcription repressor NadR [Peptococcia bacterium]